MAEGILGDKVVPSGVDLVSVTARKKEQELKGQSVSAVLAIEPKLVSDQDKVVVLSCDVRLGFEEDMPFEFCAKFEARYRKVKDIDGKELVESFDAVSYPVLAEASMMISSISGMMGMVPLVVSPGEMLSLARKAPGEGGEE